MLATALFALALGQDMQAPPLFDGLGGVHRQVTTDSPMAQKYFDQGLAFLFGFNHDEALRAFRWAAHLDPDCSMAWWGIATANGPHINNPMVDADHAKEAWDALIMARRMLTNETQVEKDLIAAAGKRFASAFNADRANLDVAYSQAMEALAKKYPQDADIGAMSAEAKMDLHPWDLYTPARQAKPWAPAIERELERVLAFAPRHPLAMHLYIHAVEASNHPERAEKVADALLNLQPALGHMVHMPSHIYVRTGEWKKAIDSNVMATAAEGRYIEKSPRQGFYLFYMVHNHQMLAFAAMMRGQSKLAIDGMDTAMSSVPEEMLEGAAPMLDGYLASIYEVRVRFGKWDDILGMKEPGEAFPIMRSVRHMARAVSWAVKGDAKRARMEQAMFYASAAKVPGEAVVGNNSAKDVLRVAELLMNGEILLGEGKADGSIATLTKAVSAEDGLRYNEPPDWLQPTRHALGAVLIKEKKFKEAELVYGADLKRLPHNGWALYGMAQAYKGKSADARGWTAKFEQAWADADTQIESSCLCVQK
jgi:tetratricopeptide (TPR) repeat protein